MLIGELSVMGPSLMNGMPAIPWKPFVSEFQFTAREYVLKPIARVAIER
jgi:hypothetical protein